MACPVVSDNRMLATALVGCGVGLLKVCLGHLESLWDWNLESSYRFSESGGLSESLSRSSNKLVLILSCIVYGDAKC